MGHKRVSEENKEYIRMHPEMPTAELARVLGFSDSTIRKYSREYGIIRPVGAPRIGGITAVILREENQALPEGVTPDMQKTGRKLCEGCLHGGKSYAMSGCSWYLDTGVRRGCPVGWCNKYEPMPKGAKRESKSWYR